MFGRHRTARRERFGIPTKMIESAPPIRAARSPPTPCGTPTEKRPVGTSPVTATLWEVKVEQADGDQRKRHDDQRPRPTRDEMPHLREQEECGRAHGEVHTLVSGTCWIVPTSSSQ